MPKGTLRTLLPGAIIVLSLLTACSNMFKTEDEAKADRISLQISRAQVLGSSGAAFTPDGRRVAIATRDMIWIANTETRKTIARLSYSKASRFGGRKSLQFIDDHRLVIGADGAIYLWDLKEGLITDRLRLTSSLQSPRAIAWSASTQTLAFSFGARIEPVALVQIGKHGFGATREFPGFKGVPTDLLFSRDGKYLAATGDEEGVFIRDVETGEPVGDLPTNGFVQNLELFGENKLLVSGANVALWTFLQDKEVLDLENPSLRGQVAGQAAVKASEIVVMGSLLVIGIAACAFGACDGGSLWNFGSISYEVASRPIVTSQQLWCGRSTSVSPDGKWLVDLYPGVTNEVVRIFDLHSGELVKTLHPRGEYHCIAKFSPNSKQLLITSSKAAMLYFTDTWQGHDIEFVQRK
jgi:WD40 repeat protein